MQTGLWNMRISGDVYKRQELLQGNFGYSTNSCQQVLARILERLPATLLLTVTAFVLSFVSGIPLGVYSATHKYSAGDYGLTIFSFIGIRCV